MFSGFLSFLCTRCRFRFRVVLLFSFPTEKEAGTERGKFEAEEERGKSFLGITSLSLFPFNGEREAALCAERGLKMAGERSANEGTWLFPPSSDEN